MILGTLTSTLPILWKKWFPIQNIYILYPIWYIFAMNFFFYVHNLTFFWECQCCALLSKISFSVKMCLYIHRDNYIESKKNDQDHILFSLKRKHTKHVWILANSFSFGKFLKLSEFFWKKYVVVKKIVATSKFGKNHFGYFSQLTDTSDNLTKIGTFMWCKKWRFYNFFYKHDIIFRNLLSYFSMVLYNLKCLISG